MAEEKTGVARWNESEGSAPSSKKDRGSSEKKRYFWLLVFAAVLTVIAIVLVIPPQERIKGGLYFGGGTETTLTATAADGGDLDASLVAAAPKVIKSRLNGAGATETRVLADGDTITVDVPADLDADVVGLVSGNGNLEFIVLDEIGDADAIDLINQGSHDAVIAKGTYEAFLDGSHVTDVVVQGISTDYTYLSFNFDDEGAKTFSEKTKQVAEEQGAIAIALDRRVIAAASVSEEIAGGGVSVGTDYTLSAANAIKATVTGDKLGFDCEVGETTEVGALLGDNIISVVAGVAVAVIAAVTVASFVRFKRLSAVVGGIVCCYLCLLLGLMALFSRFNMFVLTIPGAIAAAIATVVVVLAAWRLASYFVTHVEEGGTIRGGSISAGREGLRVFIAPAILYLVVGCVFQFLPQMALREFGLVAIYTIVAGVIAILNWGLCLLRLKAAGTIQEDPAAWGIRVAGSAN